MSASLTDNGISYSSSYTHSNIQRDRERERDRKRVLFKAKPEAEQKHLSALIAFQSKVSRARRKKQKPCQQLEFAKGKPIRKCMAKLENKKKFSKKARMELPYVEWKISVASLDTYGMHSVEPCQNTIFIGTPAWIDQRCSYERKKNPKIKNPFSGLALQRE